MTEAGGRRGGVRHLRIFDTQHKNITLDTSRGIVPGTPAFASRSSQGSSASAPPPVSPRTATRTAMAAAAAASSVLFGNAWAWIAAPVTLCRAAYVTANVVSGAVLEGF